MTCTDAQVRLIMRERNQGRSQQQAAVKANLKSRKTVHKYERLGQLPSELKQPRAYRTRADPFATDWPEVERLLSANPELEAKAVFEWLCEQRPGQYQAGQVRTLQRRVNAWRAQHQPQVASLEQVHRPGEVMQTDGTWLTELGVTIQGEPYKHLLIHSVLPYSNWEWGRIAQSESLLAIRLGLQSTLLKLGYVPVYHQTDNSTAATYQLSPTQAAETGAARGYSQGYQELLSHYGLKPRTISVGCPTQNGDVEANNGGIKRALLQHLLLRGSRDFSSLAEYERFIEQVMTRRNQLRQARLADEVAVMKPLQVAPLSMYKELRVKVSRGSLIRVHNNAYSVPTSLIGQQVTVRLYEWHLEVYLGQQCLETIPRLIGRNRQQINYRHLIDTLLRKPGGFRDYRYRDACFPSLVFRQAWEQLNQWHAPRKADLIYLRILRLAAYHLESEVATILTDLLAGTAAWDETEVQRRLTPSAVMVPTLSPPVINLAQYDRLLQEVC